MIGWIRLGILEEVKLQFGVRILWGDEADDGG